jgi:hypothetical protein
VLAKKALVSEINSSSATKSLGLWSERHSCKEISNLKIISAGWRGNFFSMVNLLRLVQSAQHWAAKNIQTSS